MIKQEYVITFAGLRWEYICTLDEAMDAVRTLNAYRNAFYSGTDFRSIYLNGERVA